jgi:hypothetical protein
MARIFDNPQAINQQPAAKVLISILETLRSVAASGRRTGLSVVRDMTAKGARNS